MSAPTASRTARTPKTDPTDTEQRKWLREWSTAVIKDGRLGNAAIVTVFMLVQHAWLHSRTVSASSRWLAGLTGRSHATEAEHLKQIVSLGWAYDSGRMQNRKPVFVLQYPQGWEYWQGRKPETGD